MIIITNIDISLNRYFLKCFRRVMFFLRRVRELRENNVHLPDFSDRYCGPSIPQTEAANKEIIAPNITQGTAQVNRS